MNESTVKDTQMKGLVCRRTNYRQRIQLKQRTGNLRECGNSTWSGVQTASRVYSLPSPCQALTRCTKMPKTGSLSWGGGAQWEWAGGLCCDMGPAVSMGLSWEGSPSRDSGLNLGVTSVVHLWEVEKARLGETQMWGTLKHILRLPWWLSDKESIRQCRRHGFSPWSRKIPHAAGQLSPCAAATEPCSRARSRNCGIRVP